MDLARSNFAKSNFNSIIIAKEFIAVIIAVIAITASIKRSFMDFGLVIADFIIMADVSFL